jgi:hypothetical protein
LKKKSRLPIKTCQQPSHRQPTYPVVPLCSKRPMAGGRFGNGVPRGGGRGGPGRPDRLAAGARARRRRGRGRPAGPGAVRPRAAARAASPRRPPRSAPPARRRRPGPVALDARPGTGQLRLRLVGSDRHAGQLPEAGVGPVAVDQRRGGPVPGAVRAAGLRPRGHHRRRRARRPTRRVRAGRCPALRQGRCGPAAVDGGTPVGPVRHAGTARQHGPRRRPRRDRARGRQAVRPRARH